MLPKGGKRAALLHRFDSLTCSTLRLFRPHLRWYRNSSRSANSWSVIVFSKPCGMMETLTGRFLRCLCGPVESRPTGSSADKRRRRSRRRSCRLSSCRRGSGSRTTGTRGRSSSWEKPLLQQSPRVTETPYERQIGPDGSPLPFKPVATVAPHFLRKEHLAPPVGVPRHCSVRSTSCVR